MATKVDSELVQELSFYRKYHYNSVNVAIHIVCIPIILLTSAYNLTSLRVPASFVVDKLGSGAAEVAIYFNAALVLALYYASYYTYLDPGFGFPVGLGLIVAVTKFSTLSPQYGSHGHIISWILWTVGWIAQFIGHGIFEKRAPALFTSLNQALVLAPYFAVFELAHALGFRRDVMDDVDKRVLPDIKAFHAHLQASAASQQKSRSKDTHGIDKLQGAKKLSSKHKN